MPISVVVITVSDRSAAGSRVDSSGPVAVAALRAAGFACDDARVVADGVASVEGALRDALGTGAGIVITTGGTGVSPRDETPEATRRVIERELPGIAEELRRRGSADTPASLLSRGVAGTVGDAVIINLPGSPAAVTVGVELIVTLAGHLLDQLAGRDH